MKRFSFLIVLSSLILLFLIITTCSDMLDLGETPVIEPGENIQLASSNNSGAGTITVTAIDTDSNGEVDGLDLDGVTSTAEIVFSSVSTAAGTYAVDLDEDGTVDFYILMDYDGTILANAAIDNSGHTVVIVTDSSDNPLGVDYNDSYSEADYLFGSIAPPAPEAPAVTRGNAQLTLSWPAVVTATSYQVFYHTADNSSTSTQFLGDADDTDTSCVLTGLANGTLYYIWIKAVNGNGTGEFSPSASGTPTNDTIAPTPGGGGVLSFSGVDSSSITVNWTAATDNVSAQVNLQYLVYYSTSDNISSVADAESNGSAVDSYAANITTKTVSGLTASTTYYFVVLVRDEAGYKAAYTSNSETTFSGGGDSTNPTPGGSGIISFSGVSGSSVTVNWTAATDNVSAQANLQYLVYRSTSDNINSVVNAESNGTAVDSYAANITSKAVTGLTASTTYYFTVLVRDEAGNKAAYTSNSQATAPAYVYRCEYDSNQIIKSGLDGSGATVIVSDANGSGSGGPIGIAAGGGFVFWSTDDPLSIHRVNNTGTGLSMNLISTSANVYSLFVDEANSKIYWADYDNNRIQRANLDGTGVETVISTVDDSGGGPLTVVSDGTFVYWTTDTETGLERATTSGTGETTLVASVLAYGLGIDPGNNLYYADYNNSRITRTDMSGGSGSNILTSLTGPGPYDGLEYYAGKVYWSQNDGSTIHSRNADGSGSTINIDSDGSFEYGVCVDD